MSRYRKIETRTWGDEKFRALSSIQPCGQGLFFFFLTGPHTGSLPGLFRAGRAALAEDLGWDIKAFDRAFRELESASMVKADFGARLVWIPNALKHNPPASPNVIKLWGKEFSHLPDSPLKAEALASMETFIKGMGEGFQKAFREAFMDAFRKGGQKASSEASGNQYQYQYQEQKGFQPGTSSTSQDRAGGEGRTANGHAQAWDDAAPFGEEER